MQHAAERAKTVTPNRCPNVGRNKRSPCRAHIRLQADTVAQARGSTPRNPCFTIAPHGGSAGIISCATQSSYLYKIVGVLLKIGIFPHILHVVFKNTLVGICKKMRRNALRLLTPYELRLTALKCNVVTGREDRTIRSISRPGGPHPARK